MKLLLILSITLYTGLSYSKVTTLSYSGVANKVSKQNYLVQETAIKVYQARKSIQQARGELLPKLNIWRIAKSILGGIFSPESMIDSVGDMAPFLIPNNWFRVQENEILFRAEKEAYRALWANEILNAKTLYLRALYDQDLYDLISEELEYLDKLVKIAKSRVISGAENQELLQKFQVWQLDLQDDKRKMANLIRQELKSIAFAIGESIEGGISVKPVALPNLNTKSPLNYNDYVFRVLDSSAERRQHEYFIETIPFLKKEVRYAVLGGSSISRGVAGGVFDHLPVSDSLGFGTAAKMDIIKGEEQKLRVQKKGIEETLKKQLDNIVSGNNTNLVSYKGYSKRYLLTKKLLKQHFRRLRMGDDEIDFMDIMFTVQQHTISKERIKNIQYDYLVKKDRLERLIYHGDYAKQPVVLSELK